MEIKLLVFDVDGTLIARGKEEIEKSAIQAITLAKEKGLHVLIATGRCYYFLRKQVIEEIDPDLYVTVNGTCLLDKHFNILETHKFSKNAMTQMIEYTRQHKLLLGFKYEHEMISPYNSEAFCDMYIEDPRTKAFVKDGESEEYNTILSNTCALGAFLSASPDQIKYAKEYFKDVTITAAFNGAYDIFPKGVDKTKTIETALKYYNINWDNVMSFGDGENDIEMLQKAKIGVAMGNASAFVQSHADYVTTHILEDGIYNALKHFKII